MAKDRQNNQGGRQGSGGAAVLDAPAPAAAEPIADLEASPAPPPADAKPKRPALPTDVALARDIYLRLVTLPGADAAGTMDHWAQIAFDRAAAFTQAAAEIAAK